MNTVPNNNDAAMEKFLADLDAVDFDDLEDDFQGVTVNIDQWQKYQTIVNSLLAAREKGKGIVKLHYLEVPDPTTEHASAMVVLDKVSAFDGDAKAALVQAAALCDHIAVTTNGEKVRASFTVDTIWKEDSNNAH